MPKQNSGTRRLQWEIAIVIVIKLLLLVLIWQLFFSANRVEVDEHKMDSHILSTSQGEHKQTR